MKDCQADLELAQRAATGDQASWRAIYESTCDRLFSLLCGVIQDRDEALDLLQETYLQAFRRIDGYRGDAPLEVWLRAIALHKALDWKRGVYRRIRLSVPLTERSATVEAGAIAASEAASERPRLMRGLASISPHQRAALLLRECEGMSFREVAAVMGCKESTARVHHTNARERMRRFLGRNIGEDEAIAGSSGGDSDGAGTDGADCLEGQPT
jgi:RNA polymerase sigma factor CnrH